MRTYEITITGTQPLLMHNDDIDWADRMEAWKLDTENKKVSKAGDDRTPAFRWIGTLYRSDDPGSEIVLPTENLMRCLMEGATQILVPGGGGKKTFKSQSQSGIQPLQPYWPLLVNGERVPFAPIEALIDEADFQVHREAVRALGFSLFCKRAKIGASKHVRVRPRFEMWATVGQLVVTDEQITEKVLADMLDLAGRFKGLCDWRPSSKTPGTFGMFEAAVRAV